MAAGPKRKTVDLPLAKKKEGISETRSFVAFSKEFLKVPKGVGARGPFIVRPWQKTLASSVLDGDYQSVLWCLPRGNGKSTLTAALCLYHLMLSGVDGARAVVVAQDERGSRRVLETAAKMVDRDERLAERVKVYQDRIVFPYGDSQIIALPGDAHRIEGEDASLAIADEIGFVTRDAYESLLLSTGKRENSKLLMIGTPSPPSWRDRSPMMSLVLKGRADPDDSNFKLIEYQGNIDHPIDCEHCMELANPGIDDLVRREYLKAQLPPTTRELEYRRARLGEWVEQDDSSFLPRGAWEACNTGLPIQRNEEVVLILDGSFNSDTTAVLAATVSKTPHFDVVGVWKNPGDPDWQVPILEVEEAIRKAGRYYQVREITADPFRWSRTLQVLESEGYNVSVFNQTPARLTPATTDCYTAIVNKEITHSGNKDHAQHIANALVYEDERGTRLAKEKRNSQRHIDLAVCTIMGHSRATWLATKKKRRRAVGFS